MTMHNLKLKPIPKATPVAVPTHKVEQIYIGNGCYVQGSRYIPVDEPELLTTQQLLNELTGDF